MSTTARRLAAAALAVLVIAAGCEGVDDVDDMTIDTGVGVTDQPCPEPVNEGNGCIYLGTLTDHASSEFGTLGQQLTVASQAFWARVNAEGGIGGFDVDTGTYLRDTGGDPEEQRAQYEDLRGDVLALTQSFGSAATAEILDDLDDDDVLMVPASWTSAWDFEDLVLQSGASYCIAAMNALDHAVEALAAVERVLVVHYPGAYGADAAGGVAAAGELHDLEVALEETRPGAEEQVTAIERVLAEAPDVLFVATGPLEMATIVGQAAARGFEGQVIGSVPTWDPGLLDSPAAPTLEERYWQATPWPPWGADSEGHAALREALGDVGPNDSYTAGWVWQYPLKAAIEAAIDRGDLTRAGLRAAAEELTEVDYEGMVPRETGAFTPGEPDENAVRQSGVAEVDPDAPTGVAARVDFFEGPTAAAFELTKPCYERL